MVQVLEVTPEERPVVGFALARVIPILSEAASEDRRVAANLSYILISLDSAPAGPGEIEMQIGDLFNLGTRLYACGVDLEEYWLDRIQTAHGLPPAEREDPEVSPPARRYFPMLDADPVSWSYRSIDPAFISLGFKLRQPGHGRGAARQGTVQQPPRRDGTRCRCSAYTKRGSARGGAARQHAKGRNDEPAGGRRARARR